MSNLFEDYREIDNVRDKLDFLIELVNSAPRRVFLTKRGEVQAILIGPEDYEDLWQIELERDMKLGDEEVARGEVRQEPGSRVVWTESAATDLEAITAHLAEHPEDA